MFCWIVLISDLEIGPMFLKMKMICMLDFQIHHRRNLALFQNVIKEQKVSLNSRMRVGKDLSLAFISQNKCC